MSDLQDNLMSNPDVFAGGSGMVEMPDFAPEDLFVPDGSPDGLIDADGLDQPPVTEPVDEPTDAVTDEPEPEAAAEPEPEAAAEPEPAPAPAVTEPPVRNKQDFLHRLNAKNTKLAARDARIAELEAQLAGSGRQAPQPQQQESPQTDFGVPNLAARRQQVLDLTIDGKTSQAAALQAEIDQDMMAAATRQAIQAVSSAREDETFNDVLADIAVTYPELDETGDAYDTKTARMINAVMAEYIDESYSRPEALRKATDEVMRLKYPAYFAVAPTPTPAAHTAPVKAQVTKAAAAARAQPSLPVGTATARATAAAPLDVFSMTDDEFAKLTPQQISELRGDNL